MTHALLVVGGYLCGSLPFGYWLVRWFRGVDIRTVGSGNIGATNVWRTFGARLGIAVVVLDTLKGFVPALVASLWVGSLWGVVAGGAAMLGHSRPVFLRFTRGGKMVATCGGVRTSPPAPKLRFRTGVRHRCGVRKRLGFAGQFTVVSHIRDARVTVSDDGAWLS